MSLSTKYLLTDLNQHGEHNKRGLIAKALHVHCSPRKMGSCERADTQYCCRKTEGKTATSRNVAS